MLSYLHAFHAGNKADIVKHATLDVVLRTLRLQARPLHYLDTHAGSGMYDLGSAEARKTGESDEGILAAMAGRKRPAALGPYFDLVRKFNGPARLRFYPGSPAIAAARLRASDRLTFCEMHPREIKALRENFKDDERIAIKNESGWDALSAGLRARSDRRLIVLCDPSYETASDYEAATALALSVKRAPRHALLMIWYPILNTPPQIALQAACGQAGADIFTMHWPPADPNRPGLMGSGMALFGADARLLRPIEAALEAAAPLIGAEFSTAPNSGNS
jgi:23S rRNA (adenine2030-N6)-methyltransferase